MAATRSNWLAQKVAEAVHEGGTFPTFTGGTGYFGLVTTACSETTTGSTAVESGATGYVRKSFSMNSTNFDYSGGSESNLVAITFASLTKASAETLVGWFLADASTGGNIWYFNTFVAAGGSNITINTNPTTPSIAIGGYVVDYTP